MENSLQSQQVQAILGSKYRGCETDAKEFEKEIEAAATIILEDDHLKNLLLSNLKAFQLLELEAVIPRILELEEQAEKIISQLFFEVDMPKRTIANSWKTSIYCNLFQMMKMELRGSQNSIQ